MKFGPVGLGAAEGAILAHSVQAGKTRLKKGARLDRAALEALAAAGIGEVIVARLDDGDVDENAAAAALAGAFGGAHIRAAAPGTGRVNLHAARAGLFRVDRDLVDALNLIDPAITFACLADRVVVAEGDMVATIKIIPLAVSAAALDAAKAAITRAGLAEVRPFRAARAGLVATKLSTLKATVMDKTRALTAERLAALGSDLVMSVDVAHEASAAAAGIAEALAADCDLVIVFGASAVTDADDVIPAAIRAAGGRVERVGMPVDPGNLLVIGAVGDVPVIGAPGCARSPKENGFDWVLARILSGESVTSDAIARLGVGGLLMEIPTRPQPREAVPPLREGVSIVLLAAGSASRMGLSAGHKLLADFDGELLVRRVAGRAKASSARDIVVVTGHRAADIGVALTGLDLRLAHNADFASGMASSLKTGLAALPADHDGVMILLGDMPGLTTADLDRLIETFVSAGGASVVRACDGAMRGNPVILPRALAPDLMKLEGDAGARGLIEASGYPIIDVDIGAAARLDVDTPEAVRAAGGVTEIKG